MGLAANGADLGVDLNVAFERRLDLFLDHVHEVGHGLRAVGCGVHDVANPIALLVVFEDVVLPE